MTNSEYLSFIESGGYEDEKWWHNNKIMEWLNGGDATEEIINDWIMKRKKLLEDPELPIDLYKKGHITLIQAACFAKVIDIKEGEFIQLVKDWYVMGRKKRPHFWDNNSFNNPNLPVVGVSWFEAVAYCNWLSEQTNLPIRLLTEDEWEATAQGKEGYKYSFGNECSVCDCNTEELMLKRVTPIGVFCETNSINGCADLNGNIFEWVNSRYGTSEEEINFTTQMICKGGSWYHKKLRANSSYRGRGKTMTRNADLGFRFCYNED